MENRCMIMFSYLLDKFYQTNRHEYVLEYNFKHVVFSQTQKMHLAELYTSLSMFNKGEYDCTDKDGMELLEFCKFNIESNGNSNIVTVTC